MRRFITGSTGFIGRHLVRHLTAAGHQVTAFLGPGAMPEAIEGAAVSTFDHHGDVAALISHFTDTAYDGVMHLATCYVAEHGPDDIDRLVDANLRFGLQVLEATTKAAVPWLINVGTVWQHYNQEEYNPTNLYAATKQAFEDLIRYYDETTETTFATIQFCDTYGPDDTRRKIFALWKQIAESGQSLAMSAGEQLIDIVHVDDVVSALTLLAAHLQDRPGSRQSKQCSAVGETQSGQLSKSGPAATFAVSSGNLITLRQLANLFESVSGLTLPIEWGALPYRSREVMVPWQMGIPVPGWEPRVSLEEGIREFLR